MEISLLIIIMLSSGAVGFSISRILSNNKDIRALRAWRERLDEIDLEDWDEKEVGFHSGVKWYIEQLR